MMACRELAICNGQAVMHVSSRDLARHAHAALRVCRLRRAYDASVFETTIRVLGGMLTAYELSNDQIFLTRCAWVPWCMTGCRTSPRSC